MNTEYSKIVNFESEVEEVEDVVIPVTEHTFTACEGFAVESLSALLPKTDENIVDLVIGSVIKQVEAIDTLEALESFAAKFANIRNVFNTPVKNIKELSTTMEPGTESYTAAMESELTQVAFVKNMFGIGEKDSCTIDDVKECSNVLKDINTVIQRRRYALEALNSANVEDIATEAKKEKDDDDVPTKNGIEDDRTMKPVDDDILTKKEFALAISMAQYFQKREEKGESVPSLGKGVTWKDVVMGIHKGHYTVNALCDLGNGKIFCKGKDGKLAVIEGSDAKEMYMRAGKGVVGNDVYIVNSDEDLDENGKPKKTAVDKARRIAKECYATAESACDGPECEPGYRDSETEEEDPEIVAEEGKEDSDIVNERESDDDDDNDPDIAALEGFENIEMAVYFGMIAVEELSAIDLSELDMALEAAITLSDEDYEEYVVSEALEGSIRDMVDKVKANRAHTTVDMVRAEKAFKAVEKAYQAFEHPLKAPSVTKFRTALKWLLALGAAGLAVSAGAHVALGTSSAVTIALDAIRATKNTNSLVKDAAKTGARAVEKATTGRGGSAGGIQKAFVKESYTDEEVEEDQIALEGFSVPAWLDTIINILSNLRGTTYAGIGLLAATGGALAINKLGIKKKEDEDYIKKNVDEYKRVYKKVTKDFLLCKGYYEKIKKTNGREPKAVKAFIDHANKVLADMQDTYKDLYEMLSKLNKMKNDYDKAGDDRAKMDEIDAENRRILDNMDEKKSDLKEYQKRLSTESLSAESIISELEDIRDSYLFDNEWVQATEAIERLNGVLTALESYLPLSQEEDDPDKCIAALDWIETQRINVLAAIESASTFVVELDDAEIAEEAVNENHVWDINWDSLVAQITNSYNTARSHFSSKKKNEALDSLKSAAHACSELGEHINSLTDKAFEKLKASGSLDKFKETKRKIVTDWENKIKSMRDEIQGKATESFVEKAYNEYLQMLGLEPNGAMESMTSIEEDLATAEAELNALLETDYVIN